MNILLSLFLASMLQAQEPIELAKLKPIHQANSASEIGEKTFIYFWASWCPDCREKLSAAIPALKNEFPKVSIVTVNMDRTEEKGKAFAESEKLSLPVYRDEEKQVSKALKIFAVPSWAVLYKKEGKWTLVKSSSGSELSEIKAQIKGIL